jgi:hypothetical protein
LAIAEQPVAGAAQSTTVTGDGSEENPYSTPANGCYDSSDPNSHVVNCFASRSLSGWLANEHVPAYQCPPDFPYLLNQNYAPFGTTLINGVSANGLGPLGISITQALTDFVSFTAVGTATGDANSSVTDWDGGTDTYQIFLHCTNDVSRGWLPP